MSKGAEPVPGAPPAARRRWFPYVISTALFGAVVVAFSIASWNRAVQREEARLEALAALGSQAVNTYLVTLEKSLSRLGESLQEGDSGDRVVATLRSYRSHFPEYEAIVVRDLEGRTIATSAGTLPDLRDQATLGDALERLRKGETMVVNRAFRSKFTGAWVTPLSYGVRDASGRLVFTIGAALSQERTHDFWKDAPLPPGAAMGLLRDDMYVVARFPKGLRDLAEEFSKPAVGLVPTFLREKNFPRKGVVSGTSGLGTDITVSLRRLNNFPLTFVVFDPTDNLRATWWASAWPSYLLIATLYFGGLGIGLWSRKRRLTWEREREAHVAELEEATQMLRASIAELQSTNSELEAVTNTISHDLRSPIRAIQGLTQQAQADLETSSDGRAYLLLGKIQDRAGRMATLMTDLLELSRLSKRPLDKRAVDMGALARDVVDEQRPEAPGASVEIGPLPECRGDAILLRQVWGNLVSNALKYSAKSADPTVRIGFADGAYFVADNGAGFDMAEAGKLFQPFARLHQESEFSGTGIGLTIVKRIVLRHGGRIWVDASPGTGAKFSWTIPA